MTVYGPLPKTLTLFMTKICDFSYPIYDLTKNLIPYLVHSCRKHKFVKGFCCWGRGKQSEMGEGGRDGEVASSKKKPKPCKNRYPIYDQNGKMAAKWRQNG